MKKLLALLLCLPILWAFPAAASAAAGEALAFEIGQMVEIKANPDFHFYCEIPRTTGKTVTPGDSAPIEEEYYISKYLVTNAQYKLFLDETGGKAPSYWKNGTYPEGKADHPVLYVSYRNAVDYCAWLSSKYEGWTFRIPSEAEWENACYASALPGHDRYKYPWGQEAGIRYADGKLTMQHGFNCNVNLAAALLEEQGDYGPDHKVTYVKDRLQGTSTTLGELLTISEKGAVQTWADHQEGKGIIFTDLFASLNEAGGTTVAVNEGYVNEYGLYGTAGNAWVWTSSVEVATNGAEAGKQVHIIRGGSWYATSGSCSAAARGEGRAPNGYYNTVGFRLAAYHSGEMHTEPPAPEVEAHKAAPQEIREQKSGTGRKAAFAAGAAVLAAVCMAGTVRGKRRRK